eukprot:6468711-Prymnesium_polylepis.1
MVPSGAVPSEKAMVPDSSNSRAVARRTSSMVDSAIICASSSALLSGGGLGVSIPMPRSPPPMCPLVDCRAPAWWPAAASSSLTGTSRGAMDPPDPATDPNRQPGHSGCGTGTHSSSSEPTTDSSDRPECPTTLPPRRVRQRRPGGRVTSLERRHEVHVLLGEHVEKVLIFVVVEAQCLP